MFQLPIEIKLQIIGYATENDGSFEGQLATQRDLTSLCMIASLSAAARHYLFHTMIVLWKPRNIHALLWALSQNLELAAITKSLTIRFTSHYGNLGPVETCQELFDFLGLFPRLESLVTEGTGSQMRFLSADEVTELCHTHKQKWPRSLHSLRNLTLNTSLAPVLPLMLHLGITQLDSVVLEGRFDDALLAKNSHTPIQTRKLTLSKTFRQPYEHIYFWSAFSTGCLELPNSFLTAGLWMRMDQATLSKVFRHLKKLILVVDMVLYDNGARQCAFLKNSALESFVIKEEQYQVLEGDSTYALGDLLLDSLPDSLLQYTVQCLEKRYRQNWVSKAGLERRGLTRYQATCVETVDPLFPWLKPSAATTEHWSRA